MECVNGCRPEPGENQELKYCEECGYWHCEKCFGEEGMCIDCRNGIVEAELYEETPED